MRPIKGRSLYQQTSNLKRLDQIIVKVYSYNHYKIVTVC